LRHRVGTIAMLPDRQADRIEFERSRVAGANTKPPPRAQWNDDAGAAAVERLQPRLSAQRPDEHRLLSCRSRTLSAENDHALEVNSATSAPHDTPNPGRFGPDRP